MLLSDKIKQQVINFTKTARDRNNNPIEACGVVLSDGEVLDMNNVSPDPQHNFIIENSEIEPVRDRVAAIYHSHCLQSQPAMLSQVDIANSKAAKLPYILYHTIFDRWDYYDPNGIHPYPLEQSPKYTPKDLDFYLLWRFTYNRSDCYTLVRGYYKGMLGIDIPDFPRGNVTETTDSKWDMFTDNFAKAGFAKLDRGSPLQSNDIILMCIQGTRTHHAAILLDPKTGKSLHNLGEGRWSTFFIYGGYWATRTRFICRYAHH